MTPTKLLKFLRTHHPPVHPVRVYFRDLSNQTHLACCELSHGKRGRHFNITIHKTDDMVMTHLLIHEWAHAVSWLEGHEVADHGPEWALAMSRIYRDVVED